MSTITLHSEKKKILVPQLRFQEFDGEWKIEKLKIFQKLKEEGFPLDREISNLLQWRDSFCTNK
jgi:hypothetical protein